MDIKDILDPQIIEVSCKATTKEQAIRELSELLLKAGYISERDGFEKDIYYRETLGQTGIGNYVAIPHGQSKCVLKNGIAIGKFDTEIPWESLDGKGVHLVCLFSVQAGDNSGNEHLKLLALLAGKLAHDEVITQLLNAETKEDLIAAFD